MSGSFVNDMGTGFGRNERLVLDYIVTLTACEVNAQCYLRFFLCDRKTREHSEMRIYFLSLERISVKQKKCVVKSKDSSIGKEDNSVLLRWSGGDFSIYVCNYLKDHVFSKYKVDKVSFWVEGVRNTRLYAFRSRFPNYRMGAFLLLPLFANLLRSKVPFCFVLRNEQQ